MNLTDSLLRQLGDPKLTADERALLRCRVAADLIHTGQYEQAQESLGELWRSAGARPNSARVRLAIPAPVHTVPCG